VPARSRCLNQDLNHNEQYRALTFRSEDKERQGLDAETIITSWQTNIRNANRIKILLIIAQFSDV
jgi:hypothetical protein